MKSLILGVIAASTLSMSAAMAQSAADPAKTPAPAAQSADPAAKVAEPAAKTAEPAAKTAAPAANTTAAADSGQFITKQQDGLLRAPKIVGVTVYDNQNKSVGKIDDLLIDHDGSIKAVVIGIGGFLGIGRKDVAVPYSAIHWQTEQRTVAVNDTAPANPVGTTSTPASKPKTETIPAAKTEAYQGYPDRAVVELSQQQLKAAPEFKYASNPANAPATENETPAAKQ